MNPTDNSGPRKPFPTFASQAEAESYSDEVGDPYFEICYHLEGQLNVALKAIHDLYAQAAPAKRPKMQTGLVREVVCLEGWPKNPRTLVGTLVACARYGEEDTALAGIVHEAMTAWRAEKDLELEGTKPDCAFDAKAFAPRSPEDAIQVRQDWLRLCDWLESRLHWGIHRIWYIAPDCFSEDPEKSHLANLGLTQRHLGELSERDRKRWGGLHERAALQHQDELKKWATVGKVQHNPDPRTWTHPEVDARLIGLWPLVARHNWTYSDLLKVLEQLLPSAPSETDRKYPLDSEASLKMHCRSLCGLSKNQKGKSAPGMPEGWPIAAKLFPV